MDLIGEVIDRARRFGSRNEQQRTYLLSRVQKQSSAVAVPALLSIFSTSNDARRTFDEQELAGYLLFHCSHSCPLPAKDVILAVLDGWNFSVEELPWYLCREFGSELVISCVSDLLVQSQEERHRQALETLAYWSRAYKTMRHTGP
jgi:hypothetical protein